MAAGLGFKDFTTGEVLTAADVDGYLMQGIWVFASTAARDAAVTSPQEGNFAFTKDTNSLWYYDGAAWVASGATGDIEGVTAGIGISGGGTSGTVTVTNSMATAIDAKGDLVAGTGADTFAKLTVGANDTVLTADSTAATGLKWAAAAGGAGNMAQIATGTWNAVSTVTLTGLSSYSEIVIFNYNLRPDVTEVFKMRLNGITAAGNYTQVGYRVTPPDNSAGNFVTLGDSLFYLSQANMQTASANSSFVIKLTNCKNAGFTDVDFVSGYSKTEGGTMFVSKGVFTRSEAISSLSMFISGTTFNNGDYTVWGA